MKVASPFLSVRIRRAGSRVLFAMLLLLPSVVAAQQVKVDLDPAQTKIEWMLVATMHTVHGTFKLKSGSVTFDANTGDASGELIVAAASGETDNASRDKKMQKEVLESQRYPDITFVPKHVTGKLAEHGPSDIQIQGVFRIHGADHDFMLSMSVDQAGDQVKASTSFVIPYQDWGMKNPSTFLLTVEKTVSVSVSAVGHLTTAGAQSPSH